MTRQARRVHPALPRARLFPVRVGFVLSRAAFVLLVAALATICVLYPDGVAAWSNGQLTISLDR